MSYEKHFEIVETDNLIKVVFTIDNFRAFRWITRPVGKRGMDDDGNYYNFRSKDALINEAKNSLNLEWMQWKRDRKFYEESSICGRSHCKKEGFIKL